MVVECSTILMWSWGRSGLVLALSLLMDASTSLPGNGQQTAPTLPSCIPGEHGGSSRSGLAAPLGCLQVVLHSVPHWQGAPQLHPSPQPDGRPSTHGQPGSANAEVPSFLTPARVCASANFKSWHLMWVPWGLPTFTSLTPEAVTRAIQTLVRGSINMSLHTQQFWCVSRVWTWQSPFFSLNIARNKDKAGSLQVLTGLGKIRASSWREMVPPCPQISTVFVLSTKQDSSTSWAMSLYSPLMLSTMWSYPLWVEGKTLGWIINCVFSWPGTVWKRRQTIPPTTSLLVSSCGPLLVVWETKKQFLESWSAHVLRSAAVVTSVRDAHSFWNVIFIPPTSHAFIYCLICRLLHCSLHCHLDAVPPDVCCFQTVHSWLWCLRTKENL